MVHIVTQYTVYGTYCGSVYSIWYILWLSIQYMVHIVAQYTVYGTYCGSVYSIWYILWLSIQYNYGTYCGSVYSISVLPLTLYMCPDTMSGQH